MEGWKNGRMVGRKDGNIGHDGMALLGFRSAALAIIRFAMYAKSAKRNH